MNESTPLLGTHFLSRLLSAALLCVSLLFPAVSTRADTLAEAWLVQQEQLHHAIDWPYSMALREKDVAELTRRHTHTLEALDTLGKIKPEPWQTPWHSELANTPRADQARSPERFDLPYLLADLRRNTALSNLRHAGFCRAPHWVEVWSSKGVHRTAWHPGATSHSVLASQDYAAAGVDLVRVIDPMGNIHRAGQASWNWEPVAVAPGSRLVALPRGSRMSRQAMEQLGDAVSELLAMRLPGDDCRMLP